MKDINYYLNLNYPLTVIQDDDGSYFVEYHDLKGCISVGETLDDALIMIEDAKKTWIDTALSNNIVIPEPKEENDYSGNFKLRIPKSLHKELADTAKNEGVSMNQLCVYLLSKELEHHKTA